MDETKDILLCIYWQPTTGDDRFKRFGEVYVNIAEEIEPSLQPAEMQEIAYHAKMACCRILDKRDKKKRQKKKPVQV